MKLAPGTLVTADVRLVRPLSEGAMGSVWVAEDVRRRKSVAVKFVSDKLMRDPKMLARFHREAQAAMQLRSPHTVQALDFGSMQDGTPYLIMELLEGESLGDRLRRVKRLDLTDTARIVWHVAEALTEAHGYGIVHRDIKPDNIFLLRATDPPMTKVFDFGIAKHTAKRDGSVVTATGFIVGTPEFMAPEQILGSKDVDQRADLWALGVVVYRALVGKLPFRAKTPHQLAFAICKGRYAPIDEAGPLAPLRPWFARALAPQLDERFSFAKDMALEFEQLALGGQPASAPGGGLGDTRTEVDSLDLIATTNLEDPAAEAQAAAGSSSSVHDPETVPDDDTIDRAPGTEPATHRHSGEAALSPGALELDQMPDHVRRAALEAQRRAHDEADEGIEDLPAKLRTSELEAPRLHPALLDAGGGGGTGGRAGAPAARPSAGGALVPPVAPPVSESGLPPGVEPAAASGDYLAVPAPADSSSIGSAHQDPASAGAASAAAIPGTGPLPAHQRDRAPRTWPYALVPLLGVILVVAIWASSPSEGRSSASASASAASTTNRLAEDRSVTTPDGDEDDEDVPLEGPAGDLGALQPGAGSASGPGFLTLVCEPACEEVLVAGQNLGASPIARVPLPAGDHTATLRRRDRTDTSLRIRIATGQVSTHKVVLSAPTKKDEPSGGEDAGAAAPSTAEPSDPSSAEPSDPDESDEFAPGLL